MFGLLNLFFKHSMINAVHLFLRERRALLMIARGCGMLDKMHQHISLVGELARILSLRISLPG
jgi:hypothetical protein